MSAVLFEPEAPLPGMRPDDLGNKRGSRAASLARKALAMLWFAILPAVLAALAVRYLVPSVVTGESDVVKDLVMLAQEHPLPLGIGLFLLFAASARYWQFALPGGRYLSPAAMPVAARPPQDQQRAPVLARGGMWEVVRLVGAIVAIALATFGVRSKVVESYSVLSGSMLPTLQPEDRLLGSRLAYRTWTGAPLARSPRRGDMIVFKSGAVDAGNLTDVPEHLVKRVIGLPGDRISMRGGIPVINGWTVPECDAAEYLYVIPGGENGLSGRLLVEFLDDRAYLTVHAVGSAPFTDMYEVQPGEVFVLGDNRNNSIDSRAWNDHHGGGVPLEAIEAQVRWFVAGKRADYSWDFSRLLRPVDSLATKMHLDGVNLALLQTGIDQCLKKRPEKTQPPLPEEATPTSKAALGQP